MASSFTGGNLTHQPYHWMLALAEAAGFAALLLVLIGTWPEVGRYPAFAGLVVVSTGLAGVLVVREGVRALDREEDSLAQSRGTATDPAYRGLSERALGRLELRRVRGPHPESGIGRAAVSATAHVGDEFWGRWLLPHADSLGAELVGPVPATPYLPPVPGALAPYSARDADLVFVGRGSPAGRAEPRPARPHPPRNSAAAPVYLSSGGSTAGDRAITTIGGRAFSEEELDRLFPPDTSPWSPPSPGNGPSPERGVPPPQAPETPIARPSPGPLERALRASAAPRMPGVGAPEPYAPSGAGSVLAAVPVGVTDYAAPFSEFPGTGGTTERMNHPLHLEALNPIPPHLRSAGGSPPRRPPAVETAPPLRPNPARSCSMCARQLWDFRSWGDCPECGDPICEHCLRLSFLTGAEGHCWDCREAPEWPAAT